MSNYSLIKSLLLQAIQELSSSPSDYAVNPDKDFTRSRKLNLKDMILLLLTMEGDCIQDEVWKFFGRNESAPTKAAFCNQRKKLSEKAFPTLLKIFNAKLPVSLYKDKYRLMACDGSTAESFRDPEDPTTYFEPSSASSRGYNMVYINAMYSILDDRFEDFVIQPGRFLNEHSAFVKMVDAAGSSGSKIIYIGDRNYASYNNLAHVIENQQYFLIRSNDKILTGILGKPVDQLREMDHHVELVMSRSSSSKNRPKLEPGSRYKYLQKRCPFDYLDQDHPLYSMSLRVVRFELSPGVFENIITNLPDIEFDFEDFKDLYHLRWSEETAFRNIKYPLNLYKFHSKKYRNIVQEIWARAILYNFSTAIIATVPMESKHTKYNYQPNYSEAFKTCRDYLRNRGSGPEIDVAGLIANCKEPIRPNRSFARYSNKSRVRRPFSFLYR